MDDWLESIKHDAILFANIRLAFSQNNNVDVLNFNECKVKLNQLLKDIYPCT